MGRTMKNIYIKQNCVRREESQGWENQKKKEQFPKWDWAWKPRWQLQSSGSAAALPRPSSSSGVKVTNTGRPQSMLDPCFESGTAKLGHLKNACPDILLKNLMTK